MKKPIRTAAEALTFLRSLGGNVWSRDAADQLEAAMRETPARLTPMGRVGLRCLAQSPGDPDDEDDLPVTCTREAGHDGEHEGGTRGGTVAWKSE